MPIQIRQTPIRSRKVPSQERSRATVDAVLAAAAHILEKQGLGALNTNAVAERAGVSIGSLYQYFSGKDAILVALIKRESEIFASELAQAADAANGSSVGEDIAGLLRFGLSRHLQKPDLARLLEVEFQRLAPHIDRGAFRTRSRAAMVRLLTRHRAAIQAENLEIAAQDIGVIAKSLMENAARRGEADWNAAIERTVRAILGYLDAEPHRMPAAAE
jgi:AcrR family transcriptional regulator